MLSIENITDAVRRVMPDYDVRAVHLFGSFARGEETSESDIDIRMECGPGVGYGDLSDMQRRLESLLNRKVEIITNPIEYMRPAFRRRVLRDQVLLYAAA